MAVTDMSRMANVSGTTPTTNVSILRSVLQKYASSTCQQHSRHQVVYTYEPETLRAFKYVAQHRNARDVYDDMLQGDSDDAPWDLQQVHHGKCKICRSRAPQMTCGTSNIADHILEVISVV